MVGCERRHHCAYGLHGYHRWHIELFEVSDYRHTICPYFKINPSTISQVCERVNKLCNVGGDSVILHVDVSTLIFALSTTLDITRSTRHYWNRQGVSRSVPPRKSCSSHQNKSLKEEDQVSLCLRICFSPISGKGLLPVRPSEQYHLTLCF
jgi:hypothetical protein